MNNVAVSEILVFKTNLSTSYDLEKIGEIMKNERRIQHWNVDLEDIDNVLRIVTDQLDTRDVIALVRKAGFHCEELPD